MYYWLGFPQKQRYDHHFSRLTIAFHYPHINFFSFFTEVGEAGPWCGHMVSESDVPERTVISQSLNRESCDTGKPRFRK